MAPRLLAAVLAVTAAAGTANAEFVDSFANPDPVTDPYDFFITREDSSPFSTPAITVAPGVTRQLTVNVLPPAPPSPTGNIVNGFIGEGRFDFATRSDTRASAELTYTLTGSARDLSTLGSIDLNFLELDAGNTGTGNAGAIPSRVVIVTATGNLAANGPVPNSTNPFTQSYSLSDFTVVSGTPDLSQTNRIRILLNQGNNSRFAVDYTLDSVSTTPVPAPGGLVLAGIGFVGLVGRSRFLRRKAAAA